MWIVFVCVLEAVVIVTGNVAVLVVFTRTSSLRKRKYYLLVSLAMADLLVGLISVPYYFLHFLTRITATFRFIYQVQDAFFGLASVFGIATVAIERAYAVYFPFKHRTLRKGTYMIGVAVIWMMALLFPLLGLYNEKGTSLFVFTFAAILISLVVVIISYILIWIKMNCMSHMVNHAIHRSDMKMTVTLLIVTIISLIAWIPFQVISIYSMICRNRCPSDIYTVAVITKILQYGNSLVNPIIYALRMPQFRRALVKQFKCNRSLSVEVGHERPSDPHQPNVITLTSTTPPSTPSETMISQWCQK